MRDGYYFARPKSENPHSKNIRKYKQFQHIKHIFKKFKPSL